MYRGFCMNLNVHEVFEKVSKAKTRNEKVEVLKKHGTTTVKVVLRAIFDDGIVWNLPEGIPPYKREELPANMSYRTLECFVKNGQFGYLVKGGRGDNGQLEGLLIMILPARRERMFIEMLESVENEEVKILEAMKNKKISGYKGLTKALVEEAFPGLIPVKADA